ncbi:MAG TPA: signal peptidase I [Rhodospirillales bacterium]|jgi:signal peptidase I|nr:signal peptidase I [Rhodospirillales bacterium]HIL76440.1 signal peptidase I [Rhodospirillales bacterium]
MKSKNKGGFLETLKTVVYAVLIAMVVRTIGYEPFNIPSGSMIPTLLVGDYLFVSKFSYGFSKHSLIFSLPLIPGRIWYTEPKRGDVAVFKLPSDNSTDYIKRIIGLPGEKIQMRNGRLFINGKIVQRERLKDFVQTSPNGNIKMTARYKEILPNGKSHDILEEWGDKGPLDNTGVYQVPSGHYFAMGDNRDNSQDSRVRPEVGFIPKENLVGRAEILFFSTNGKARIWEIWNWPVTVRFIRLFKDII